MTDFPTIDLLLKGYLDRGIQDRVFPGGVAHHSRGSAQVSVARGTLDSEGTERVDPETVYDLASLTKIAVTLPLILIAVRDGLIDLDDRAAVYLPELADGAGASWNGAITIRTLLAHTSGLPAWRPYFIRLRGRDEYLRAIANESPVHPTGTAVVYSDLGFMLLGWILERVWDENLVDLANRLILDPLGMTSTGFLPATDPRFRDARIAPTEKGNEHQRKMARDYAHEVRIGAIADAHFTIDEMDIEGCPLASDTIRGSVHDANCAVGLGGVSGHAGLFSTAIDLSRYAALWEGSDILPARLRGQALRQWTPDGAAVTRGLGWILDGDGMVSHTGFTGTSLWYDSRSGEWTIVLTNRVHPTVKEGIGDWRASLRKALHAYGERSSV